MEQLTTIIGVIFPTFFIIFLGYYLRRKEILGKEFIEQGNVLIFNVFMPLYMFVGIYRSSSIESLNMGVLLFIMIFTILIFIPGYFILDRTAMDDEEKPVILQAMVRPNLLIFGIALADSYYGVNDSLSNVILTLGFLAPITNVFAVLGFELFSVKGKGVRIPVIVNQVLTNRLILAAIISIIVKISGITIPEPVIAPLEDMSRVTTPLGLLFIGANLRFIKDKKTTDLVLLSVVLRNLIIPVVGLSAAAYLGFRGPDLFASIICLSAPVAISSYIMTCIYTGKENLASRIIMATTLASAPGLFIELLIFRSMGFI